MKAAKSTSPRSKGFIGIGLLAIVLLVLFWQSFLPGYVHFANDGPLGQQATAWVRFPGSMTGAWDDQNSIGNNGGAAPVTVNTILQMVWGPVGNAKFLAPLSLLILGAGAWAFFRQLKFTPAVATLGALAAMLNSTFFSAACWGVATQEIGIGMVFFAMALVVSIRPATPATQRWARLILAGMAVGINVMEALDIGAILSMFLATFVIWHELTAADGRLAGRMARGVGKVVVIALCAAFISAYTINSLIGTQIKGVVGTQQDQRTKQQHWDFATQWSLPKKETLGLFMPGLFGYRMDTPRNMEMFGDWYQNGMYWGAMGRDPAWYRYFQDGSKGPPPQGFMRFSGGGNYTGVLVVLLALWAAFQGLRGAESALAPPQRRLVWFWSVTAVVSLLLAYGRFAPFYQLIYALPYFSTIRNPAKFLQIFSFAMVVLFAYGGQALIQRYAGAPLASAAGLIARFKRWWAGAGAFDRRWVAGCGAAIGASLAGWLVYSHFQGALQEFLTTVQFDEPLATQIAGFSIHQVLWFALFLAASSGLVALILCGALAGRRAKWAGILLGVLLLADLGRANLPWIIYWYYPQKYQTNPVIDRMRDKPFEHRVAILPYHPTSQELALLDPLYRLEWAQHLFPYYNIQSLDIIQMSRMPEDLAAFESAFQSDGSPESTYLITRRWTLTNTRYLLGPAAYLEALNAQLDPAQRRFRILIPFNIVPKQGIENPIQYEELTAEPSPRGPYALYEFTGALPRAKLFTRWQVPQNDKAEMDAFKRTPLGAGELAGLKRLGTNDYLTLNTLVSPSFDPAQTVLLAAPAPELPAVSAGSGTNSGAVDFTSYAPKDIKLQAKAEAPSILLLNDKYDPSWRVTVDGKPAELLRCNFIMRGVAVPAGTHEIEFRFVPPVGALYVNLAGVALGLAAAGVVVFHGRSRSPAKT